MVEATPATPFLVTEPDLLLEFVIVTLDAPTQLGARSTSCVKWSRGSIWMWLCSAAIVRQAIEKGRKSARA